MRTSMSRDDVYKVVPLLEPVCTSEIIARCSEWICEVARQGKIRFCGIVDLTDNQPYGVREKTWQRVA